MKNLRWIEIAAFRGFGESSRIDLDADSVVITGANGSGKTSLIDAITWTLTGAVPRLEERRERRTDDVVTNRYMRGSVPRVTLAFSGSDGSDVEATRELTAGASSVAVRINGELVRGGDESLARAMGFSNHAELSYAVETWGVLHQDSMRAVLEARPEEFQRRLREILGLAALDSFENWIKSECKNAADEVKGARERLAEATRAASAAGANLESIQQRKEQAVPVAEARQAFVAATEQAAPALRLAIPEASEPAVAALLQEIRRLQVDISRQQTAYAAADEALAATEARLDADPDALAATTAAARAAYEDAQRRYEEAEIAVADFRRHLEGLAALAAAAIPHLGPTCPVCGQDIDAHEVRTHLEELLDSSGQLPALQALEEKRDQLRQAAQNTELAVGEAARAERAVVEWQQEISRLRAERAAHEKWFESLATDDALVRVTVDVLTAERTAEVIGVLRRLEGALQHWQSALADQALELQESSERVRLAEAEAQKRLLQQEVERLAASELSLRSLASAATEAVVSVTGQWLTELNPLFGAVYNRLAAHPTFTELGLEHDVYYGKGRTLPRVYDRLVEIGDNPQIVCSEGQLNIVALSYFIAFSLSAGERSLPFMIMDDPLQFMDEINVLGFADLCRHLRSERQVLVTTHDRRFARLLERKLRPRSEDVESLRLDFVSWERAGPGIEAAREVGEPAHVMLKAST
jgi:DNA repair exonuclease SbcCD ATPase subunit